MTDRKYFGFDGPETPDEVLRKRPAQQQAQISSNRYADRTETVQGNLRSSPLARDAKAKLESQRRASFANFLQNHPDIVEKRTRRFKDGSKHTNFKPVFNSGPAWSSKTSGQAVEPTYVPSNPPVPIRHAPATKAINLSRSAVPYENARSAGSTATKAKI